MAPDEAASPQADNEPISVEEAQRRIDAGERNIQGPIIARGVDQTLDGKGATISGDKDQFERAWVTPERARELADIPEGDPAKIGPRPGTASYLHDRVNSDFGFHAPDDGQSSAMNSIRLQATILAHRIVDGVPVGREQSTALTKLEEAVFHANAGIARHG